MIKKNTDGLAKYSEQKNAATISKVNEAIDKLKKTKPDSINFSNVAKEAGVSKATLYNNDILRERISALRTTTKGVHGKKIKKKDEDLGKKYLEEIRKLKEDKKNLIIQLLEMEAVKDENEQLRQQLDNLRILQRQN